MIRLLPFLLSALLAVVSLGTHTTLAQGAPTTVLPIQPTPYNALNPGATPPPTGGSAGSMNVNLLTQGTPRLINLAFSLFSFISLGISIYAGSLILFSGGDKARVEKGIKTLLFAGLGMLLVGGAWIIVRLVLNIDITTFS